MTLGECINNYLNEHKMSMRRFASTVGVSHAYISNIVNEKTSRGDNPTPSITVYKKIASAMGMDVNTLIAMVDDEIAWGESKEPATNSDGYDEKHKEFNELLDLCDPAEQDIVIDFLKTLVHRRSVQGELPKSD